MKITILVDDSILLGKPLLAEHGFSCLLETSGLKFLFDVGYQNIFLQNALTLGYDLLDINSIILSHGHLDHTWGLQHLIYHYSAARVLEKSFIKPALIACEEVFLPRRSSVLPIIGSIVTEEGCSKHFDINLSNEPFWLTDKLVFLGRIPRVFDWEMPDALGEINRNGENIPDFILDDSALAYKSELGLVIISGCSHSGICNIIEYAKKVCSEEKVFDVIGGLHLINASSERLLAMNKYLKSLSLHAIYPCHCTDLAAKCSLKSVVQTLDTGAGLSLEYK